MRTATSSAGSCSQNRRTRQPASVSRRTVSESRARLREIFAGQYSALCWKVFRPCSGQPCQKHPSMNTATWTFVKTMSARRLKPCSGAIATRYLSPRACKRRRTASSGPVSRDRFACMFRRRPGEEAQDSVAVTSRSCHRARRLRPRSHQVRRRRDPGNRPPPTSSPFPKLGSVGAESIASVLRLCGPTSAGAGPHDPGQASLTIRTAESGNCMA